MSSDQEFEQLLRDCEAERLPRARLLDVMKFMAIHDRRALPQIRFYELPIADDEIVFACPFCDSMDLRVVREFPPGNFRIRCCCCDVLGPTADFYDGVVKAWNEGLQRHSK